MANAQCLNVVFAKQYPILKGNLKNICRLRMNQLHHLCAAQHVRFPVTVISSGGVTDSCAVCICFLNSLLV
jgi:plasmid maintenance system killer protein